MLDLLITHASLADGRSNMSVAVQDGKITEVSQGLQAPAHETVDAKGLLLSSPFVDAHFHMDATRSYGLPRVNASGTLLEGIALWGELKPQLTHEALVERALAYCDWAVARGILYRLATGRLSARRRAAQPGRPQQYQASARPGCGRSWRYSAL